jgi:glycosyltransferase involved in cell wall biosynthesis
MNIVLVNHYAGGPSHGMEFRPFYMAKEWTKLGHTVYIVSGSFSHLRSKNPLMKSRVAEETINGINYIWLKTNYYKGNGPGRIISMFAFCWRLYKDLNKILRQHKPDLIIASSTYPLDNFPVRHLARRYGAKYCYEVHDLWPLSVIELGGYSPRHPFIQLLQRSENFAYENADYVISMLPNALQHMLAHGLSSSKYCHVPNGISTDEWLHPADASPHVAELRKLANGGKFLVGYTGGFAVANALDTLIEAAALAQGHLNNVIFVLIGSGNEKQKLQEKTRNLHLQNIFFLPAIQKSQVPAVLSAFDILYLGSLKNPLYRFGISPNKLFDYMMAAKAIIHSVEAGNDIVSEAQCGITIRPEDPALVVEAIVKILEMGDEQRKLMGKNGQRYVLQKHSYEVLAQRFINFCNK